MRKLIWTLFILLILIQSSWLSASASNITSFSADEWGMFRHDPGHSGYTESNGATNSVALLWNFTTMSGVFSSPAVVDDNVFFGSNDGIIYCINSSNGEWIWYYIIGSEIRSSPAIDNGFLYVGSNGGVVYALNASDGTQIWNYATGNEVQSSPAVVYGVVYIGSRDGNVYALNASDGAEIWRFSVGDEVISSPAVSDGMVYFASYNFFVYALNSSTGAQIWRQHTGSTMSSPTVHDGSVYIGSYDGYVCSLNASTGVKIWEYQTEDSVYSSPAVAYGCVYVGANDNYIYCLNASSGEKIWRSPTGYWVWSSPTVAEGNVYVGSEDYSIYCLNASTGQKKWSYETGGFVDSSPAIMNGNLYFGSSDHRVYAFALFNSTVETFPSQTARSLPWTTVAFDVIIFGLAAVIVIAIVNYVYSNRHAKRKGEFANISNKNLSWISAHANTLCILVIVAFSAIFFVNLGNNPLWAADEQTYSQWAFNMFKTGDYMTPWAYGGIFWVGKPPLIMWLMALAYQIFGVNIFATRFWSPIFGAFSLITIFYLGKKIYNLPVGFLSALVLGTFTTFYLFARHAMTDVPFVFFMLASIYFLLLSDERENISQHAALSGLFLGLAFMTKQIQVLLIPLITFSYFIATKRSVRFLFTKRFALFWGVGILVILPWAIYMTIDYGVEFWQWFFMRDAIVRTISPLQGHVGDYFYYFRHLINGETLLWVIMLPFAVGFCAFNSFVRRSKANLLLLLWMAIVLLIFTFAQTKIYWYILPAFPAFAIAISSFLHQISKKILFFVRLLSFKALEAVKIGKAWKRRRLEQNI